MSHIRGAVLVVTMFVVSAVAIASASAALPEFEGMFPKHFVALQSTNGFLETKAGRTIECKHGSALGLIRSAKDLLVNGIIYTECKYIPFGGGSCLSIGASEGEITTNRLLGLLGYISKPNVGILFEPDNAPDFATFKCHTIVGDVTFLVKGTVICPLSPVNTTTDKYTLDCKMKPGEKGVQEPLSFEGAGTMDTLMTEGKGAENFAFEQSGVSASSEVLTLGATKINA